MVLLRVFYFICDSFLENPNPHCHLRVFFCIPPHPVFMKRRYTLLSGLLLLAAQAASGQSLATVSGLRLYEHHSPTIAGSAGANGTQSGYDFVSRKYFHSYNKANMGAYTGNQPDSIDLVEHNGPFSTKRLFGFTSGVSAIWNGDIKGNGTTKWMEAPASFSYATATTVQQLKAAYDSTKAKPAVDTVKANTTYIGRIRNTNQYVALRTAAVKNKTNTDADVYFDFEYKYGTLVATGIATPTAAASLLVYPNPAGESVSVENPAARPLVLTLAAAGGQTVARQTLEAGRKTTFDLSRLPGGLYLLTGVADDGRVVTRQLVRQ